MPPHPFQGLQSEKSLRFISPPLKGFSRNRPIVMSENHAPGNNPPFHGIGARCTSGKRQTLLSGFLIIPGSMILDISLHHRPLSNHYGNCSLFHQINPSRVMPSLREAHLFTRF